MKINVVNTIIYCENWLESVIFYRDQLKLEVIFANDWFFEFKLNEYANLSVADQQRATVGSGYGEGFMLSFKVDDVSLTRLEMKSLDLDPTPIATVWNSQVFSIFDPEGVRIEFWSQD